MVWMQLSIHYEAGWETAPVQPGQHKIAATWIMLVIMCIHQTYFYQTNCQYKEAVGKSAHKANMMSTANKSFSALITHTSVAQKLSPHCQILLICTTHPTFLHQRLHPQRNGVHLCVPDMPISLICMQHNIYGLWAGHAQFCIDLLVHATAALDKP
jgi:hypothetical protein